MTQMYFGSATGAYEPSSFEDLMSRLPTSVDLVGRGTLHPPTRAEAVYSLDRHGVTVSYAAHSFDTRPIFDSGDTNATITLEGTKTNFDLVRQMIFDQAAQHQ